MTKSIWRSWKSSYFHEDILNAPKVYTHQELGRIRKDGHTGLWVHGLLRDISHSDIFPEFNQPSNQQRIQALRMLTEKADSHDLEVFVYLVEPRSLAADDPFWQRHPGVRGTRHASAMLEFPVGNALCTSEPAVLDFLENSVGNLFKLVPKLKGLLIVTASEHLHHCLSFATPGFPELYKNQYDSLCPKCRDREPVAFVSEIINRMAKGAFAARPDAEIIAWNWNWNWFEPAPPTRLVAALDKRIGILASLNLKGAREDPTGTKRQVNEYALSYIGPSEHCLKYHELVKTEGRRFYLQLVLGTTHELASVPCIPVPHRVYEKVLAAQRLTPFGFMGWTFGNVPSVNLSVAARLRSLPSPPEDRERFLKDFAAEYLPGCDPELVCKAWRYFSMGIDLYPFDNRFLYYGPVNYALAYKQFPGPVQGKPMPQSWLDLPRDGDDLDSCCGPFSPEIVAERFEMMAERFDQGVGCLKAGTRHVDRRIRDLELARAAIIPLVFHSVANIFSIHLLKKDWKPPKMRTFRQILRSEHQICRKALPLLKQDELIGFHTECQAAMFSEPLIRAKMRHIRSLLRNRGDE
jgi:hypothetical protein